MGPKGQAVIPKSVREKVGIRPGDEVEVHEEQGKVIMEPVHRGDSLRDLLRAVPKKKPQPKHVDWNAEYRSQFG